MANLYLHWFDKLFQRHDGPAHWANAKLEGWLALKLNREKTRVVNLNEAGARLDFLDYTFRYDRSWYEGGGQYLNLFASQPAVAREVAALHDLTSKRQSCKPLPVVIAEINQQTRGWGQYFKLGYPAQVFRRSNGAILMRLQPHMNRRSQRRFKKPADESYYAYFKRQGVELLNGRATA